MSKELAQIIADFTTQLSAQLDPAGTTATLQSQTDDDGNTIPDGLYFFTLDGANASKEHIVCTKTGLNLTNIYSVSRQGVQTAGSVRKHRIGCTVTITDFAHIAYINQILRGQLDLNSASPIFYDANFAPSLGLFQIPTWDYVKAYVDALVIAGAPTADNNTKGISFLTTTTHPRANTSLNFSGGGTEEVDFTLSQSGQTSGLLSVWIKPDATGTGSAVIAQLGGSGALAQLYLHQGASLPPN